MQQMPLFLEEQPWVDLLSYDRIVVAYSGGKDSTACVLWLLESGVSPERMELWHYDVDGGGPLFMDWPCTRDYCRAVAVALGIAIRYGWRQGGFEREMLRENARTAQVVFETPEGVGHSGGVRGKFSTRRKFPQPAADLRVRWCSAVLKIDVGRAAICGQERFLGSRILLVTGERAEESPCRSRYRVFETEHGDGRKRTVHHYRPVHKWSEAQVWEILERHRINPHPCYRLGWGRCSCACCIFASANQWASLAVVLPEQTARIIAYEEEFGRTVNRRFSVRQLISMGTPYRGMRPEDITAARSGEFSEKALLAREGWKLPAGAFGEQTGPG
jgi:3'-phosphoadenosine 5'-phosphosulfate sulfotransferase (PAPS reductase)/FAD synthetase